MVEITTLTLATPKRESLRTTVPISIVRQFKLEAGDNLSWEFEVKDGNIVIIVYPIKTSNSNKKATGEQVN